MKSITGQYELTEKQEDSILNTIRKEFGFDELNDRIFHPTYLDSGRRHIDIVIGNTDKDTCFVTFGCSSKKVAKRPYVEVFAKVKDRPTPEFSYMCNNLIRDACYNDPDLGIPPKYELALLNGYEFLFLDGYEKYHDSKGYWGLFICPRFTKQVTGIGEVEFYQIIPAYKEELVFVEENMEEVNYKSLCKAITEHIAERQYLDVSYEKLSEEKMIDILNSLVNR